MLSVGGHELAPGPAIFIILDFHCTDWVWADWSFNLDTGW